MTKHVHCGSFFAGNEDKEHKDWTLVVGDDGAIVYAGPTAAAPLPGPHATVVDYSGLFVMPGLLDVHTHLAYGNAKTEEDIDLYQPLEFRAIRGLFFAQKVVAAGYTSICAPGDAGQISLSVRNAIRAGLFEGPRVTAAGRYLTTPQGLTDWYPTWIGAPETSIGRLVSGRDEAIEEIRRQAKNGVDCIKIALDGFHRRDRMASSWPPSPRRRRRSWCRRRTASARKWWCMRAAAKPCSMRRVPPSISFSTPTFSTTSASRRC